MDPSPPPLNTPTASTFPRRGVSHFDIGQLALALTDASECEQHPVSPTWSDRPDVNDSDPMTMRLPVSMDESEWEEARQALWDRDREQAVQAWEFNQLLFEVERCANISQYDIYLANYEHQEDLERMQWGIEGDTNKMRHTLGKIHDLVTTNLYGKSNVQAILEVLMIYSHPNSIETTLALALKRLAESDPDNKYLYFRQELHRLTEELYDSHEVSRQKFRDYWKALATGPMVNLPVYHIPHPDDMDHEYGDESPNPYQTKPTEYERAPLNDPLVGELPGRLGNSHVFMDDPELNTADLEQDRHAMGRKRRQEAVKAMEQACHTFAHEITRWHIEQIEDGFLPAPTCEIYTPADLEDTVFDMKEEWKFLRATVTWNAEQGWMVNVNAELPSKDFFVETILSFMGRCLPGRVCELGPSYLREHCDFDGDDYENGSDLRPIRAVVVDMEDFCNSFTGGGLRVVQMPSGHRAFGFPRYIWAGLHQFDSRFMR